MKRTELQVEADRADREIYTALMRLERMVKDCPRECRVAKLDESLHLLRHARVAVRLLMNEEDVKRTS